MTLLEGRIHRAIGRVQAGAHGLPDTNANDGDHGGDESIFDRGDAGGVPQECSRERFHVVYRQPLLADDGNT